MTISGNWKIDLGNRGVLAPGQWLWARAILWGLLLFAVALLGFFSAIQLSDWLKLPKGSEYLCAALLPVITMIVYAASVRLVEKRRVTELAIRKAPLELIVGASIGISFMAVILAVLWALGLYKVDLGHRKHWYNFFLFNSYISGLLEELAFRAIVLRILARMIGPIGGLLISAILFGVAHAGHAPLMAVVQIVINGGLVMGLLYMVSGRLWLSIGMHIGYDFTEWSIMGVGDKSGLLAIAPTPGRSALLTGGDFGPDGSIFAGLVGLMMVSGILIVSARRSRRMQLRSSST